MQFVKDPLQVKYYERQLGRKLTEEERNGEKPVYIRGVKRYLEIHDVNFPYDFMTLTQLHSYYASRKK